MRIFKNTWFTKFARKEGITDAMLRKAIDDVEHGKVDADYGGGVIKQRIARPSEGKSGGYRSIIYYKQGNKAFFVYGFAKKNQSNISKQDERNFKASAKEVLNFSDAMLDEYVVQGIFEEIEDDDEEI